eukprot:6900629-Lingulodinium_polyedra.AAC.1
MAQGYTTQLCNTIRRVVQHDRMKSDNSQHVVSHARLISIVIPQPFQHAPASRGRALLPAAPAIGIVCALSPSVAET